MGSNSPFSILNSQLQNRGTVLLVEDNEKLNELNRRVLEGEGYEVWTALTLAKAREQLLRFVPEVILLDVMLPDGDGVDFCAEIRDLTDAHIIFLTSRNEHEEKLRGLSHGGDDYITKPFMVDELITRVAAAMRRRGMDKNPSQSIAKGRLRLDTIASQAFLNDADLLLKPKEYSLLHLFVLNENKVLDSEFLYEKVWKAPLNDNTGALRIQISRLRKKLEGSGYTVTFNQGDGYCFQLE